MNEMPHAAGGPNPYESPTGVDLPDENRFRLLPVIIGWLVDFGGSMVLGVAMGMYLGAQEMARNPRATTEELMRLAANPPQWFLITSVVLGLLCTAAGGYVTAWLARGAAWKHVFVMSLLSVGAGVAMLFFNAKFGTAPTWWQFAISLLAIPAAFTGGWLRVVTRGETT